MNEEELLLWVNEKDRVIHEDSILWERCKLLSKEGYLEIFALDSGGCTPQVTLKGLKRIKELQLKKIRI